MEHTFKNTFIFFDRIIIDFFLCTLWIGNSNFYCSPLYFDFPTSGLPVIIIVIYQLIIICYIMWSSQPSSSTPSSQVGWYLLCSTVGLYRYVVGADGVFPIAIQIVGFRNLQGTLAFTFTFVLYWFLSSLPKYWEWCYPQVKMSLENYDFKFCVNIIFSK